MRCNGSEVARDVIKAHGYQLVVSKNTKVGHKARPP